MRKAVSRLSRQEWLMPKEVRSFTFGLAVIAKDFTLEIWSPKGLEMDRCPQELQILISLAMEP